MNKHTMSMYASKDDLLSAVMRENEELRAKLVAESARTAEQKLRADQMTQQHAMQANMHAHAEAQLAAVQQGVQPVGEVCCDDHGSLPLVGTSAVLYNAHPFGTKLYTHPTQQGLDAQRLTFTLSHLLGGEDMTEKLMGLLHDSDGLPWSYEIAVSEIDAVIAAQAKLGGVA